MLANGLVCRNKGIMTRQIKDDIGCRYGERRETGTDLNDASYKKRRQEKMIMAVSRVYLHLRIEHVFKISYTVV